MKSLDELIDETESTWLEVQDWVAKAANTVEILPANPHEAAEVLHQLQVTTRSVLGTVAYYTGGILIENGWLRILGSGSRRLPRNLITWNEIGADGKSTRLPSSFLIADDVVGGFFALNGGAFEGKPGDVFYFAPDTLEWESLDMGFSDFLYWACFGDVQKFYETFRWEGWAEEIRPIDGNQGVSIYPFLWTDGAPVTDRARSVVPIEELWNIFLNDSKLK